MMDRALAGVWTLAIPALGPDSGLLAVAVLTAAAVLFALVLASRSTVPASTPLHAVAVRLILLPLGVAAARGERSRTAVLPQLREITEQHRDDPDAAKREIALLQAESGSLSTGCLPMLAQLPFFWVLYRLYSTAVVAGESNQLLTARLSA